MSFSPIEPTDNHDHWLATMKGFAKEIKAQPPKEKSTFLGRLEIAIKEADAVTKANSPSPDITES